MPQSLVRNLVHVVFSTKNRVDLITPEIENGLFGYMHGIVENNHSKLILANGTTNHVHLLISLGKIMAVSELIGDIKRDSSVWIEQQDSKFGNLLLAGRLRRIFGRANRRRAGNEIYRQSKGTS